MLSKLIKYDFKSCWKRFWPVWLTVIILAAVNGWSIEYCNNTLNNNFFTYTMPKLVMVCFATAATVLALSYIYEEFAKGLLGRQGYLMFTLPIKEENLLLSKGIVAVILEALSAVTVVISLIIFISIIDFFDFRLTVIKCFLWIMEEKALGNLIIIGIIFLIFMIMTAVTFNLHIYTAVALGHLSKKYGKVISLIAFIGLCVLSIYILAYIGIPVCNNIYQLMNASQESVTFKYELCIAMACFGAATLMEYIYSAVLFFVTCRILKTNLNLE